MSQDRPTRPTYKPTTPPTPPRIRPAWRTNLCYLLVLGVPHGLIPAAPLGFHELLQVLRKALAEEKP